MRKTFVTFLSPGTFVDEETSRELPSRDVAGAARLAPGVTERYGAKPYAFYFSTLVTADPVPDGEGGTLEVRPREVDRSGLFFLGGVLETVDDVRRRADPRERILLSNMECNDWPVVVVTTNSCRSAHPFREGDVIVDDAGEVVRRGDESGLVAYRAKAIAERRGRLAECDGAPD